jgi:hypothetical protein
MNPFDEIAIEESLKLREKKIVSEIIAITIGPSKSQETLRTALALGVDKAVHIETDEGVEVPPLQVYFLKSKLGVNSIIVRWVDRLPNFSKHIPRKVNLIWLFWVNKLLMMIQIKLDKCWVVF